MTNNGFLAAPDCDTYALQDYNVTTGYRVVGFYSQKMTLVFGLSTIKKTKIRLCRPGCGLRLCFARQQDHKQGGSHLNTCSRKRL